MIIVQAPETVHREAMAAKTPSGRRRPFFPYAAAALLLMVTAARTIRIAAAAAGGGGDNLAITLSTRPDEEGAPPAAISIGDRQLRSSGMTQTVDEDTDLDVAAALDDAEAFLHGDIAYYSAPMDVDVDVEAAVTAAADSKGASSKVVQAATMAKGTFQPKVTRLGVGAAATRTMGSLSTMEGVWCGGRPTYW